VSKAFTTNCFTGDEPTDERGEETERDRGAEAEEEEDEEQDSKADAATCANSR